MTGPDTKRYTLGFISSWHLYEGTTIDPYAHAILQGLRAAVAERDCNLLLACGIGPLAGGSVGRPAWPLPSPGSDFVPVGPWNVDGLIVSSQRLTGEQTQYIQDLIADGFPVVFNATDLPGPAVAQDNFNGVKQAISHLISHGHRRIAFIAVANCPTGDFAERMQAYVDTLNEAGLEYDTRLVAYGECSFIGGQQAMREILATGAPFTAVVANNDRSGFGAVRVLKGVNLRVPEDVAVIGYDNILESQAQSPAFSTVHNSTFTLGYRLVDYLIERIKSGDPNLPVRRVPVRLVVRQSCGCQPGRELASDDELPASQPGLIDALAHTMAEASLIETQHITQDEVEALCHALASIYIHSLEDQDFSAFDQALSRLLKRLDELDEDALAWHNAISVLQKHIDRLLPQPTLPNARQRAIEALDRVRQEFNEHSRLQTARKLFQHMDMSNRLSLLTAQLMSVRKESEITAILREHLGPIRLRRVAVVLLEPDGPDTIGRSRVLLQAGEGEESGEQNFITRHFPPPGFCPGLTPFQLALLPLVVDEQTNGYMVFDAANLEPCGSMVRNLASALRSLALYRQAIEGRRLAEEANQLKSRFLSMVSHELRTPLNLIVGLSEMLLRQKDQAPVPTENLWQDLERIFNSAQHLGWLISDVLDLASSEAGQLRLIREPLDLTEVLQVVAVTGEQLAHGKDLIWEARLPSSGPWVLGDRTRLRQVALNFISNAVKFTEHGKVTMEVTTQDDQVAVAISDTGLGVPVEEQAEIFNEFHCSEVSIKRGYGGIGLGLAISRQLIELHQGTIGLYSSGKEGSGSTFFFMLPIIHPQEASRETDTEQPAYHLSIALLTEQVETFAPLADQLTRQGIKVKVYPVGKDPSWLPKLLVSKPGAVILDEQLASRQGWEILCVLKRHKPTQQVPVMVHSYDLKEDHGTLLELNYLQKPLSPDHLAEMLYSRGLLNKGDSSIRTILVVDDEPGTLDFNTRLIQQQVINCKVLQARNGREALTIIRESLPDLVLLDLMMPELDGFGVLEAMRENDQTRNIAVVVLTAKSLPEADMARLNRGVAAILNKGMFSSKEIVDHIEGALSKSLTPGSAAPKMVRKAVAYIHENYQEPLTREQIAEYIGINADYLTVCFNHELGIPPMTYLSRYRITRARTLLETQEKKITEIAMEVGFSDSAYFSRIFQRETGVSPRAYQRGVRGPG